VGAVFLVRSVLVIVVAYLVGSIPFGYLIVRAKEGSDIRQTGSGGTGATNVSRRAGKAAGILTLILDALKGAAAVLFAMWVFGLLVSAPMQDWGGYGELRQTYAAWAVAAAALAVMLGHIFPVWLKFKGGKGVATGVGVFLILLPTAVAGAALVFLVLVLMTRFVSLGSIAAAVSIPLLVWLHHVFINPLHNLVPLISVATAGAFLIVFAHRENIARLVQGRESKFR
jgi:acyl phosphate:glycerol-3-phosphate acyltransferase